MQKQGKKKLASLIVRMKKIDDEMTLLLEDEKKLLDNRGAEVDEESEPKEITEADVECLSDMVDQFAKIGQTLSDHFELE